MSNAIQPYEKKTVLVTWDMQTLHLTERQAQNIGRLMDLPKAEQPQWVKLGGSINRIALSDVRRLLTIESSLGSLMEADIELHRKQGMIKCPHGRWFSRMVASDCDCPEVYRPYTDPGSRQRQSARNEEWYRRYLEKCEMCQRIYAINPMRANVPSRLKH